MAENTKVTISNIVPRGYKYKEKKGEILSKVINDACYEKNIPEINHNTINP